MSYRRVLLVGELIVDVTLQSQQSPTKVRLGGVFHALRGAWAAGIDASLAFFGPAYLDQEVATSASRHGDISATKIGNISGTPNVMLIAEPTEAGNQGYEHLLAEQASYSFEPTVFAKILDGVTDVLVICGNYDLTPVLRVLSGCSARIHIDVASGPFELRTLRALRRPLATLFISTSSRCFASMADNIEATLKQFIARGTTNSVVLKENRGGSRYIDAKQKCEVGAQRRDIVHSVGVGDVFDLVFVSIRQSKAPRIALAFASWIAAEYAATTFPDDFRREVQRVLNAPAKTIADLAGVRLAWEDRSGHSIYIAAPDFDYVNRQAIDDLVDCLKYHNFTPRLPVREHGQANDTMSPAIKRQLYDKDVALLESCSVLIAVNILSDPGTYIEIGMAEARGIPVLVYDPYRRASNVMLVSAPIVVSDSLDVIITATFDLIAKKCAR